MTEERACINYKTTRALFDELSTLRQRAEEAEAKCEAMRAVVEAARRVDACEEPEARETAEAFHDLRTRLAALSTLTGEG